MAAHEAAPIQKLWVLYSFTLTFIVLKQDLKTAEKQALDRGLPASVIIKAHLNNLCILDILL